MDGVVSLVEVISNKFVPPVFNVRKVFFEAGVTYNIVYVMMHQIHIGAQFHRCRVERIWSIMTYTMLYFRQLNCSVMFIWDLIPITLVLVPMMDMFYILLDCMEWSLVFLWLVDAV